jgi:hypothetical protein
LHPNISSYKRNICSITYILPLAVIEKKNLRSNRNQSVFVENELQMSNIERNTQIDFYNRVVNLLKEARKSVVKTINKTMVYTYFEIGRIIVEEEQQGKERAAYGNEY